MIDDDLKSILQKQDFLIESIESLEKDHDMIMNMIRVSVDAYLACVTDIVKKQNDIFMNFIKKG